MQGEVKYWRQEAEVGMPKQVVVIAGASAGIGRATARLCGARGRRLPCWPEDAQSWAARPKTWRTRSALSERSIPLQAAYCGAKHAINGFTESLRTELLHDGSNIHITVVQMPAVNTPQFSCVLSRLPRHPLPVPPIYQPEVAARGVVFAADHPQRKQYWVSASTVGTLLGRKSPRRCWTAT